MAPSHSTAPIQTIPVTQMVTASIRVLLPVSIQKIRATVSMCVPVSIHVTVST
jgi:hypothetical protein